MVDNLITKFIFPKNTSHSVELANVLVALETEAVLTPTHASTDERKRLPYEREAALSAVCGKRSAGLHLWRGKAPKYSNGYISANDTAYNNMSVEHGRLSHGSTLKDLFAAWTRMTDVFRPEFGFVHPSWDLPELGSKKYDYGARVQSKRLRDLGLCSLHARTWFGPDLVSVIGRDRLLNLQHATPTSWGGMQLDLVEKPWLADFETLYQRQRELVAVFESWGLMANYARIANVLPGPNWIPRLWDL